MTIAQIMPFKNAEFKHFFWCEFGFKIGRKIFARFCSQIIIIKENFIENINNYVDKILKKNAKPLKKAKSEKSIEIEMPLTVGRIPFKVRYTTEFDNAGRPVKAYGSATYIPEK